MKASIASSSASSRSASTTCSTSRRSTQRATWLIGAPVQAAANSNGASSLPPSDSQNRTFGSVCDSPAAATSQPATRSAPAYVVHASRGLHRQDATPALPVGSNTCALPRRVRSAAVNRSTSPFTLVTSSGPVRRSTLGTTNRLVLPACVGATTRTERRASAATSRRRDVRAAPGRAWACARTAISPAASSPRSGSGREADDRDPPSMPAIQSGPTRPRRPLGRAGRPRCRRRPRPRDRSVPRRPGNGRISEMAGEPQGNPQRGRHGRAGRMAPRYQRGELPRSPQQQPHCRRGCEGDEQDAYQQLANGARPASAARGGLHHEISGGVRGTPALPIRSWPSAAGAFRGLAPSGAGGPGKPRGVSRGRAAGKSARA